MNSLFPSQPIKARTPPIPIAGSARGQVVQTWVVTWGSTLRAHPNRCLS